MVMRWVLWGTAALILLATVTTAAMWPRDDVPHDPDAVVVLGGAGPERARLGIELRDRFATTLVLSTSAMHFAREEGIGCSADVICIFKPQPETTIGEARRVAELADEHGWDRITVVTTRFHTTRARVLFRQCLGDDVAVVGAEPGGGRGLRTYLEETAGTIAGLTFRRAC
jgi:uncharacterized SAM-binding protein YcdF (DUF218 family)